MDAEVWFKLWCPKCNAINWLCDGRWDVEDSSETDMEACMCWKCGHSWWLYETDREEFCDCDAAEMAELGEKDPQ